jgi:NAD/NADP transhydrogenase alpha subunit
MKIGIPKEIDAAEPRVAAVPDTIKKLKALGADVAIEPGPASNPACPTRNSRRQALLSAPTQSGAPTSSSR